MRVGVLAHLRTVALALPAALALVGNAPARAATAAPDATAWYTVQLVVFAERSPDGLTDESWRAHPGAPDVAGAVDLSPQAGASLGFPGAFAALRARSLAIDAAARRLERSGRYRVLLVTGWRQPALARPKAVTVRIGSGAWPPQQAASAGSSASPGAGLPSGAAVEGTLRVYWSRFAHAHVDLLYHRPADTTQDAAGADAAVPVLFRLDARQRMRPGRLYYIDHPLFGVLIEVERSSAPGTP